MLSAGAGRNAYRGTGKEICLLPSAICYADILGWKAETEKAFASGHPADFLAKAASVIGEAYEHLRQVAKPIIAKTDHRSFEIKTFTDHIVIARPCHDAKPSTLARELETICGQAAFMQGWLASRGFLLRGGIACGQHYMDDDFAYGDALLEAVKADIEGSPPRILVMPSAVALLADLTDPTGQLLRDNTGDIFVNYLEPAIYLGDHIFHEVFAGHRDTIGRGLADAAAVRAGSKFRWAGALHNWYVRHQLARAERWGEPSDGEDAAERNDWLRLGDALLDDALIDRDRTFEFAIPREPH